MGIPRKFKRVGSAWEVQFVFIIHLSVCLIVPPATGTATDCRRASSGRDTVFLPSSIVLANASGRTIATGAEGHENLKLVQQHRATHQPHGSDLLLVATQ